MKTNKNKRKFFSDFFRWTFLILLNQILWVKKLKSKVKPRIVVVGGGFGGLSCLKYLSNFSNLLNLTLIEKEKNVQTCPFSNLVIGDIIKSNDITFNVNVSSNLRLVNKEIKFINSDKKKVFFYDNSFLEYDFLILSPGISYKKNQIEGYSPMDSKNIPACWGVEKKINIFKSRLNDLENNSLIIISAPDYPYRCPPAPYERASMIANFLKKKKTKFKILIFDSKDSFTKKETFLSEWKKLYGKSIEWVPRSKGGLIEKTYDNYIVNKDNQKLKSDFIHIIPEQRASNLIANSNLSDDEWCKINPVTFQLSNQDDIYVIGDSIDAGDMPKSSFSANSQSKVLAINLINRILGKKYINPVFLNTCYSFSADNRAFSISSWYRLNNEKNRIVSLGTTESNVVATKNERLREYNEAFGWYESITTDLYL